MRRYANYTGVARREVRVFPLPEQSGRPGPVLLSSCWQRSTSRTASGVLAMNSNGAATKCWSSTQRSYACTVPDGAADNTVTGSSGLSQTWTAVTAPSRTLVYEF